MQSLHELSKLFLEMTKTEQSYSWEGTYFPNLPLIAKLHPLPPAAAPLLRVAMPPVPQPKMTNSTTPATLSKSLQHLLITIDANLGPVLKQPIHPPSAALPTTPSPTTAAPFTQIDPQSPNATPSANQFLSLRPELDLKEPEKASSES